MRIRDAAEKLHCGTAIIRKLIAQKAIRATRDRGCVNAPWRISSSLKVIRSALEQWYPDRSSIVIPKVRYHLSDEECWSQSSLSYMAEGQIAGAESYTVVDVAYLCPVCKQADLLEYNGREYYCARCSPYDPVLPLPVSERRYSGTGFTYPAATTSVAPSDSFYETETRYLRTPASSNWPRGRNNPNVNPWNEGAPRAGKKGFRATRKHLR
jgi:hypothetical protein